MLGIFIVDATNIVAIIKTIIVARPCEDTITLTAEWENYPAREGGKTTKGENHFGDQGGRTWQAFGGDKNGHETFRQVRIYNFRDKCVIFARNLNFS